MAAKKTTAPALAEGQTIRVLQYGKEHGPDSKKILRRGSGKIKRVGRSLVDIRYRLDGHDFDTTDTFYIANGEAKGYREYPLRFRTDAQLEDELRRGETLAVLARHDLRPMSRLGYPTETDLSTDTLVKIAALIAEAEEN